MSPATRRGLLVFLLGAALIVGAVALDFWWSRDAGEGGLAAVVVGGPFTLTDQTGAVRHDSDFRGKLMLVYFGYTYCPDACPAALGTMSAALDRLGAAGAAVQPIFITLDPARDTVAQMKSYAANFAPQLVALTGSDAEVATVARSYRVFYQKVRGSNVDDYTLDHTSLVYLMGRDGKYLAHFLPDATADQMAAAIKQHL